MGQNCKDCPLRKECTSSKKGRHISRFVNHDFRQLHRKKMDTPIAKQMSNLRKSSIEHIMGTLKVCLGKIPLLTRGIEKVSTEIRLFSSSYNIKRLLSLFTFDEIEAMIAYFTGYNCQRTFLNLFYPLKFSIRSVIISILSRIKYYSLKKLYLCLRVAY